MAGLLSAQQAQAAPSGPQRPPAGVSAGTPSAGGSLQQQGASDQGGAQYDQPNVTPEEQAQYDQFIDRAFRLIYDQKSFPTILKRLTATPDPVEGLAAVVVMVVTRLRDSAKQQGVEISPDVLYHGGAELLEDVADTAAKAGIYQYTPEEMEKALYRALDLYRTMERRGGGDPRPYQQDWDALMQADQQGRLGEMLPQLGQGGQPPANQAPPSRGLLRQPQQGGM
ncbi:hypothetical protein J2847_004144 [Azospirillum agricola]|uniref:hypothetical protein n=1 Tax=Azospirillum agricola TaxID=1720247 RepID=UPI001AE1C918|nr:hypothetical protein [Azospirillum agricola]MBP2230835.1 hypothetical protein [Azospirillum agricola]